MFITGPTGAAIASSVWGAVIRNLSTIANVISVGTATTSVPFGTVFDCRAAAGSRRLCGNINTGAVATYNVGTYDGATFTGPGPAPSEAVPYLMPNSDTVGFSVKNTSGAAAMNVATSNLNFN